MNLQNIDTDTWKSQIPIAIIIIDGLQKQKNQIIEIAKFRGNSWNVEQNDNINSTVTTAKRDEAFDIMKKIIELPITI